MHIIITLIAGLIVTIVNIIYPVELTEFVLRLVVIMFIFLILGIGTRMYFMHLKKILDAKEAEEDEYEYEDENGNLIEQTEEKTDIS